GGVSIIHGWANIGDINRLFCFKTRGILCAWVLLFFLWRLDLVLVLCFFFSIIDFGMLIAIFVVIIFFGLIDFFAESMYLGVYFSCLL
ncbi:hypothetical protein LXA00_18080, partial [Erwinia amylovora]|uniref:hypothetical protein n=1 Tax=Erwinia amylovora TaxID=552 RepID=UPI0020BDFDD9